MSGFSITQTNELQYQPLLILKGNIMEDLFKNDDFTTALDCFKLNIGAISKH